MMNVTEALHCTGCGFELGLCPLPLPQQEGYPCPRCRTQALDAFDTDGNTIYDCGKCGGQFVGHDVLKVLVTRHQAFVGDVPLRLRPHNPMTDKVTYLPCPICKDLMLRRNFGKTSGIIVDLCNHHGTWFDVGELPRILAFVSHGGLTQAKAVESAEKKWHVTQAASLASGSSAVAWSIGTETGSPSLGLADMEEATLAFVRWIREMFR